ncbi:MAG: hypothetical protein HQK58_04180 [Deltaproteobacteria bacterium]|nr:hypothetical protein [Deltaproteobacteria bacterium]
MKKLTMVLTIIGLLAGIATFVFAQATYPYLGYAICGVHSDGTKVWKCTTASPTLWYTTCTKSQGSLDTGLTSNSSST